MQLLGHAFVAGFVIFAWPSCSGAGMPFGPEARRRCSACNRVLSASNFSKHLRSCELYKAQQRRSQTLLLSCFPQAATNGDTSAIDDDVEEPDDESSHGLLKCPRFDMIGMGASAAEASALQAQHMPGPHTRSDHATGDLQLIEWTWWRRCCSTSSGQRRECICTAVR